MNAKFAKALRKYCRYNGFIYDNAKKLYQSSTPEEQTKYRKQIEEFVHQREEIEKAFSASDTITFPSAKQS